MSDVCVSTRIRFARNISGFEFPNKLEQKAKEKVLETVFEKIKPLNFRLIKKEDLSEKILGSFQEKNLVSRDFVAMNYNGLAISDSQENCIMINEEDHIRIQVIKKGYSLKECFEEAVKIDETLSQNINFSYNENFGFLTACPTNLGTGMRASVMLFLPALTTTGNIPSLIEHVNKLGFTVRGMNGEGSKMDGFLYQVSNSYTLGLSEEEILNKVDAVVKKIEKLELEQRKNVLEQNVDTLKDKLNRSYGILTNAYMLDTKECIELLAEVKYGVVLGLINISNFDLLKLIEQTQKYNLIITAQKDLNEIERDKLRAQIVKNNLIK